ncbi:MAG TPA: hypothetical protein PK926_01365 [Spirochaetota bacterium]|nr:hypothetical protein [Spirochaetota bacterium]HPI88094.1 hypothetical protein [Spirochaetota bacterium]HPR46421.1 hypothetical protein [Spirochaetota bacterium]
MPKNLIKASILSMIFLLLIQINSGAVKTHPFLIIEIEDISRYNEDRITYQHIEKITDEYTDNSIASLLIIRDSKVYLFKDGYDSGENVSTQKRILEMENRLIPDLWENKIDGNPDYIMVTDRRVELLKNITQDFVTKNFGEFYSTVRDEFLKKHVSIFNELMVNRKNSGLFVRHEPLAKRVYDTGPTKYFISVTAKTIDEKIYYAEDADGDGITETFMVSIPDGFHWGYKSGPNIICIYNNTQENVKNTIGKLAHDAFYGTPEEEKIIKESFPKKEDITEMIEDIYKTVHN